MDRTLLSSGLHSTVDALHMLREMRDAQRGVSCIDRWCAVAGSRSTLKFFAHAMWQSKLQS
eukprot:362104-Chlamydomonas_euryale.AAC.5